MKIINVGVLGAGRIGQVHVQAMALQQNIRVLKVSDPFMNDKMSKSLKSKGVEATTKDENEIFEDTRIDAVFICSPTDTHCRFSLQAIKMNMNIFCEKPIDMKLSRIEKITHALKNKKIVYQVGFNRRFDHNFIAVRDAVRAKKIGTPQMIRITSRDPLPPPISYIKESGGLFMDMMIHDFDMARFQTSSDAVEIYALGGVLVNKEIGKAGDIDSAVVTIKFSNGMIGYIENCRQAVYGYDQRVEILGSNGAISIGNDRPSTTILSNKQGVCEENPLYFFLERYKDAYLEEQKSFFDSIRKKRPAVCGVDEGYESVRMAYAARLSLKENRPVRIKEIKGDL